MTVEGGRLKCLRRARGDSISGVRRFAAAHLRIAVASRLRCKAGTRSCGLGVGRGSCMHTFRAAQRLDRIFVTQTRTVIG